MAEGSWSFSSIVVDWLGGISMRPCTPVATRYLVHRDSLLGAGSLDAVYRRIGEVNREMSGRLGASYSGLDGARPPRRWRPEIAREVRPA